MDQYTHEVRAEYWKGIIKACGQRPAGQAAKGWMEENGICEQSYYYYHWQRKFRKQAYEQIGGNGPTVVAASGKEEVTFVELPCTQPASADTKIRDISSVAVIQTPSMKIEITNGISDSVLSRILREVPNA